MCVMRHFRWGRMAVWQGGGVEEIVYISPRTKIQFPILKNLISNGKNQ